MAPQLFRILRLTPHHFSCSFSLVCDKIRDTKCTQGLHVHQPSCDFLHFAPVTFSWKTRKTQTHITKHDLTRYIVIATANKLASKFHFQNYAFKLITYKCLFFNGNGFLSLAVMSPIETNMYLCLSICPKVSYFIKRVPQLIS